MFVFLLPYVCASLWGHVGEETEKLREYEAAGREGEGADYKIQVRMEWGVWEIPLEEYLIYKLSSVMPKDYEKEALKAQAVLLRTEAAQALREQEDDNLQLDGDGLGKWYEEDAASEEYRAWREAVEETAELYLCYQGEPIQASYFKVSNGQTREAAQVWDTDSLPYLAGTTCTQDKAAIDYSSTIKITKNNYLRVLQEETGGNLLPEELWEGAQIDYDSAGYVTDVSFSAEGKETVQIDGETFRYLFDLPSASFTVEQEQTQIFFRVKGVGHGFGMSQYGANCMALNGETYDEILQKFFFGAELAKFE